MAEQPFVEIEYCQIFKDGQCACGDHFEWRRLENENRNIAVLSDGLGSGIKANLLATMTTTMALEFMRSNKPILHSAEIIMDSLPVCEVRRISYATFTIVDMLTNNGRTRVIEMGNPGFIHLRGNIEIPPKSVQKLTSARWPDREMTISEVQMVVGDRLIFCSDGVTQAGLGSGNKRFKFGWRRAGVMEYACKLIQEKPDISAHELSRAIAYNAISINPGHVALDDTSCCAIYFRKPRVMRLLTGPPFHKDQDSAFAALARRGNGADSVVVCGGTTANIICRELATRVKLDLKLARLAGRLPPPGEMINVGLATEGILTLTAVAGALENHSWDDAPLAARQILDRIEDSDVIEFIVGTKVNEAHQDPQLPVDLELRRNVVRRLKEVLEEEYRKKVTIKYY